MKALAPVQWREEIKCHFYLQSAAAVTTAVSRKQQLCNLKSEVTQSGRQQWHCVWKTGESRSKHTLEFAEHQVFLSTTQYVSSAVFTAVTLCDHAVAFVMKCTWTNSPLAVLLLCVDVLSTTSVFLFNFSLKCKIAVLSKLLKIFRSDKLVGFVFVWTIFTHV